MDNQIKDWGALEGKTIVSVYQRTHSKYDDDGYLDFTFSDGTSCTIVGGYAGYTGNSYDEYPSVISIASYGYEE